MLIGGRESKKLTDLSELLKTGNLKTGQGSPAVIERLEEELRGSGAAGFRRAMKKGNLSIRGESLREKKREGFCDGNPKDGAPSVKFGT